MASSTMFSALAVPLEDSMEVSSPGAGFDHDIDIEFEDYGARAPSVEDDRMLEDGDQNRPGTANDEEMGDDEHRIDVQHAEEVMRDEPAALEVAQVDEDDELIDYDELDYQTTVPDHDIDTTVPNADTAIIGSTETVLPQDSNPDRAEDTEPSDLATTVHSEGQSEHVDGEAFAPPASHLSPPSASHQKDSVAQHEVADEATTARVDLPDSDAQAKDVASKVSEPSAAKSQDNVESNAVNDAADEFDSSVGRADHDPTPTDTGLHPMTIRYGDVQLPLFKARTQPDGLLKDDNLASVSLAELFQSCRQELAVVLGDEISQDQDFVLGIDHLGILLVEDSRSSFETSLNDILEVYLHLHQNDGTEDVPPLSLTLSLQLKFASSLALFKEAASQGRGISSFSSLHSADNVEEYYNDEDEEEAVVDEQQAEAENEANGDGGEEYADEAEAQSGDQDLAATSAQVDDIKTETTDEKHVDGQEDPNTSDLQAHPDQAQAPPAQDESVPAADDGNVLVRDEQSEQGEQVESYENGEEEFAEEFFEGEEEETGDVADPEVDDFDFATQGSVVGNLEAASTISSVTAQGEPAAPSQNDDEQPEADTNDDILGTVSASRSPHADAEDNESAVTTVKHPDVADGQDLHDPTIAGSDDLAFNLYPEELFDTEDGDGAVEEGAENEFDEHIVGEDTENGEFDENNVAENTENGEFDDNNVDEIAESGEFVDFETFDQTDYADEDTHYPNEDAENQTSADPDGLADSLDVADDADDTRPTQDTLDEADTLDFQDDDDLGFDDLDNHSEALKKPTSAQTPTSALGKRSFESHANDSIAEDDEPESKMARSV